MAGTINQWLRRGVVATLLAMGLSARADTVVLKDGVTVEGALLSESADEVSILSSGIEWTYKKRDVETIKRNRVSAERELTERNQRRARRDADDRARAERELAERRAAATRKQTASVRPTAPAKPTTLASSGDQVVVYSTSWCGYCRKAKAYFRSRDIPFVDKDIEADPAANQEMLSKCAANGVRPRGVPVIDVYGTMILGFNQPSIDAALANHR